MTSRWLSFGRVLFSPAHNHVKTGTHGRILVIDGLGNDDWSFYCSLTYPDAEVYSLSGRPVSTAAPHPAAWQPPTNHHTVYHAGLHNPLPFPKDYFTATVLRFPVASPESVQNNMIQECKRVLRSGGYIEMSLLDRDMINMGVRTRRAVRRLKEMTYLADSSISLKPSSDNVQRLLGTQGFDNLRRCMVRIPVAGMVVRSSDSTTSSSSRSLPTATTSSPGFDLPAISITPAGSQSTHTASKSSPSDDTNKSLGDLLSDPYPSPPRTTSLLPRLWLVSVAGGTRSATRTPSSPTLAIPTRVCGTTRRSFANVRSAALASACSLRMRRSPAKSSAGPPVSNELIFCYSYETI
ncbi:hypothetical protein N7470_004500 [Penicillium chermesinum]|nr:hypothetical protein N7470_004500 [Penicillium chermesinum]